MRSPRGTGGKVPGPPGIAPLGMKRPQPGVDLGGRWSFALTTEPAVRPIRSVADLQRAGLDVLPASVPGNLELDLLASGLIQEPFAGMNVVGLRRFEGSWVYYVRSFDAHVPADTEPYLVFEGIDCFADVFLNGVLLHRADNMLVEHHVPLAGTLRGDAENTLCVVIEPAIEHARSPAHEYPPGLEAEGSGYGSLYVRKAPHMYGWDIMPRALSAGLWRPVTLHYLPLERLEWVWLETQDLPADGSTATAALHYRAITGRYPADTYSVRISGACGASRFEHRSQLPFAAGSLRFQVDSPRRWWPRGRGAAAIYDVQVELLRDGLVLDSLTFTHGFRTVELDRTSVTTEEGQGEFCFRVNGERLFILGTNWAPLDAYHSRDRDRIRPALEMVDDLGCNMIRCWGGNVYEDDLFYDICDRKGILVWQDFAMACAIYPQDDAFQAQIRSEARQVVRRLRQHPCVAVWVGDNECDQKYLRSGRRRDPNANVLTRHVIPQVLREEDPSRPYLPSSPYVDEVAYAAGERYLPEDHLWRRDFYKDSFYTSALCHFASEIGYHGCPEPESLRRSLSADKLWPFAANEEWLLHSTEAIPGTKTHDDRVDLMVSQVRSLFGAVPEGLDEFAFASQSSQAEGLKFFIEMFRSAKWRRTGIIWWNLIDGWPQISDAVVDYYFTKKRAYEVIRRSQAAICVMGREPADGMQEFVVVNDTRDDVPIGFVIRDVDSDATVLKGALTSLADAVTPLGRIGVEPQRQRCLAIEWETSLGAGRNHYLAGPPPFSLARYRSWMKKVDL